MPAQQRRGRTAAATEAADEAQSVEETPAGLDGVQVQLTFSPPVYVGGAMWMADAFWRLGLPNGTGASAPVVIGALDLPVPRAERPPTTQHEYMVRAAMLTAGHDACPPGPYTVAEARAHCIELPDCEGFTFETQPSNATNATVIPKVWSQTSPWLESSLDVLSLFLVRPL